MNKVELLAPAGNLEKLKIAILYGADAVYLGGQKFSLRARANNFTIDDIIEGCKFAKEHNAKIYVTMNIIPHNTDFVELLTYLKDLEKANVTGIIVSSLYIANTALENTSLEVHLSTQMSVSNSKALEFYKKIGFKRVVLARELNIKEIKRITKNSQIEIEAFIHGGMCSSISGRCMLSNHMTNRDANRGGCAHSCRWNYDLYDNDKKINDLYFNIGSKDLCAISYIYDMIKASVKSLKIEGRMKSLYYIATVVRCYRFIIDKYYRKECLKEEDILFFQKEMAKAENRVTSTGFLNGEVTINEQLYNVRTEVPTKDFLGIVVDYDKETGIATIEQRNYFEKGNLIEVFGPKIINACFIVNDIQDENCEYVDAARHPLELLKIHIPFAVEPYDMLRKK